MTSLLRLRTSNRFFTRKILTVSGRWPSKLTPEVLKDVESHWSPVLSSVKSLSTSETPDHYILSMFPYPSGKLHMGHVRVYAISDALARFYRFKSEKGVLHPMGFDSFGLPAENAAIRRGVDPAEWTQSNIRAMKEQLKPLGLSFDWDREVVTSDPLYYKWTQWIFLQMFKKGLAYRKESIVNWDPVDKTVLADEQVDNKGISWRSGAVVEKKPLTQWYLKTTAYAQELYEGLGDPLLEDWKDIESLQKHWIGECTGTVINFPTSSGFISVWTDRPELVHGISFIGVTPDHVCSNRISEASNPFTSSSIPVVTVEADSELFPEGSNSFLCIPDSEASHFRATIERGLKPGDPVLNKDGKTLINSGYLTGLSLENARKKILEEASVKNIGGHVTSSKLKDWLISRQRYWGTPIPIIHCPSCGIVPVPESDLPVTLPPKMPKGTSDVEGISPLAKDTEWVRTDCPQCHNKNASRETDTMDTFVDSSWYFLRYLDPKNEKVPVDISKTLTTMPVTVYIGGKEHAIMHLFYARFVTRFLHDIGISSIKEPFKRLLVHGLVKGKSYRVADSGKYIPPSEVNIEKLVEKSSGKKVFTKWEKMSKSKFNGVDPGDVLERYGPDTTRSLILADVSPFTDRSWAEEESLPRIRTLQNRLWLLVGQAIDTHSRTVPEISNEQFQEHVDKIFDSRNYNVKLINYSYEKSRNLSSIFSRVQSLLNDLWTVHGYVKKNSSEFQKALGVAIITLSPICPHLCSELWAGLASVPQKNSDFFDWNKSVFEQKWPELDHNYNLQLRVAINGSKMTKIPIANWRMKDLTSEEAFHLCCSDQLVQDSGALSRKDLSYSFTKFDIGDAQLDLKYNLTPKDLKALKEVKAKKKSEKLERRKNKQKNSS